MKIKIPFILAFLLILLVGCDKQSNETVLDASKWFVDAAIDEDLEKMKEINHAKEEASQAKAVLKKAKEAGIIDFDTDQYYVEEIDKDVVAVSFGIVTPPWILEFKKEKKGYYFSNFLSTRKYKEQLSKITPQWIIEPKYTDIKDGFHDGRVLVQNKKSWRFLNKKGKSIISKLENATPFSEKLASVKIDGKWGVINTKGNFVIEPNYEYIGEFHDGLAKFMKDEKYGFIDKVGNVIIEPIYDEVGNFSEGLAYILQDEKYGFIDKNGKLIVKPKYNSVGEFKEGMCWVKEGKKVGYINKKGKLIIELKNEENTFIGENHSFSEELVAVQQDGKFGYMNKKGEWVIEPQFIRAGDFHEGLAYVAVEKKKNLVRKDYKYGYINKDGKFVIEPKFDAAYSFYNGKAAVKKEGKIGIIDKNGKWIGDTIEGSILKYKNGILITYNGNFINNKGKYFNSGLYDSQITDSEIYENGQISLCLKKNNEIKDRCGVLKINTD